MPGSLNCQKCGFTNLTGYGKSCAKCGHSFPASPSSAKIIIIIIIAAGLLSILALKSSHDTQQETAATHESSPNPSRLAHPIDKSPTMQAERLKMINSMIGKGIFGKVEAGPSSNNASAFVRIRPRFYALDFETKNKMIGIIYAYYCTGDDLDLVILEDSLSGKTVGSFSTIYGGLKMD